MPTLRVLLTRDAAGCSESCANSRRDDRRLFCDRCATPRLFWRAGRSFACACLRDGDHLIVSLVADCERQVVGHIAFSRLTIECDRPIRSVVALAPLAVLPGFRRRGIGTSLVREGLALCEARGVEAVTVLGEPDFYGRVGFSVALARNLECAYNCDAFQAVELRPNALRAVQARLMYPAPFQEL